MTCEVVVMNRMGVALAADSAVTADVGENSKIRDSGVKLFMLSKYRPVGVMVYNNSLLLGVSWEIIIKLFREEFGRQRCDTAAGYAEALIDFLQRNTRRFFPEKVEDLYFAQTLEAEFERISNEISDEWEYVKGGTETEAKVYERITERALTEWQGMENEQSPHFNEGLAESLLSRNSVGFDRAVGRVFAGRPLGDGAVRHLRAIAKLVVTKAHFVADTMSGLVIAGFGEIEHFPAVQHMTIGGVYAAFSRQAGSRSSRCRKKTGPQSFPSGTTRP